MFFNKFPYRANFAYAKGFDPKTSQFTASKRTFSGNFESYGSGVYRLTVDHPQWGDNRSLVELIPPSNSPTKLALDEDLGFGLLNDQGKPILCTSPDRAFGVCADAWALQFEVGEEACFYGMGEKNFGRLELSGIRTKFWNTDVWSDFHVNQWLEDVTDPPYLSVPY